MPFTAEKKSGMFWPVLFYIFFITFSLHAQSRPYRGAEYRTKQAYTYGRFEVRMKSAQTSGMLCSFFTYHDPFPFSASQWNEIDIEILGRYTNEVQFNTITPNIVDHVQRHVLPFNPHMAFHIYGFEWTPDYVAWLVDGFEVYRQTGEHIKTLHRAQKIMMNIWQPAWIDWAGSFDASSLPKYGYYDWVKYYAYTPEAAQQFTLQWIDDFDAWDQAKWDKATHTWDRNNALFTQENAVFQNGYLILCLTMPEATGYRGGPIVDLDLDPPYPVWARAIENKFHVYFSEELEQTSAETVSNYIATGVTLTGARLLADNRTVELSAQNLDPAVNYLLVVSGVRDRSPSQHKMGVQTINVSNALRFPVRINLGGAGGDSLLPDQEWAFKKEYGHVGGTPREISATITGAEKNKDYFAAALQDPTFYHVLVPEGTYDVTLLLAETEFAAAGTRVFDVYAEGEPVLQDVDIYAAAGGNAALEKHIPGLAVTDGRLDLYFKEKTGVPILHGLIIERIGSTGVGRPQDTQPRDFNLGAFPNPFNLRTEIQYVLAKAGDVRVSIYNIAGQKIRTLLHDFQRAGVYQIRFDATEMSAGVYFVNLVVEGKIIKSNKLLYLK